MKLAVCSDTKGWYWLFMITGVQDEDNAHNGEGAKDEEQANQARGKSKLLCLGCGSENAHKDFCLVKILHFYIS